MTRPAAVVLLSGGLDSMVCAALAREAGFGVLALTVDYNQRHRVELEAARTLNLKAAWLYDNGQPFGSVSNAAKLIAAFVRRLEPGLDLRR